MSRPHQDNQSTTFNATANSDSTDPALKKRKFTGVWIPAIIYLHKKLNALEKILWAEIFSLDDDDYGGCWAGDDYLCKFLGVSDRQLRRMLKTLKDEGLVQDVGFNGRTKLRKALIPQLFTDSVAGQTGQKCPVTPDKNVHPPINTNRKGLLLDRTPRTKKEASPAKTKVRPPQKTICDPSLKDPDEIKQGTVTMSIEAYEALCKDFGEKAVMRKAYYFSLQKVAKPKQYSQYTNHAATLRNWLTIDDNKVKDEKPKSSFLHPEGAGTEKFRAKTSMVIE